MTSRFDLQKSRTTNQIMKLLTSFIQQSALTHKRRENGTYQVSLMGLWRNVMETRLGGRSARAMACV